MPSDAQIAYAYVVRLDQSTDGQPVYVAMHPELPGCMAHGPSAAEALRNLEDARSMYLADLEARGLRVDALRDTRPGLNRVAAAEFVVTSATGVAAEAPAATMEQMRAIEEPTAAVA